MKKWFFVIGLFLFSFTSQAQFSRARLQATGLTCAMCSNAINKALKNVPFVQSVDSDIKNSAFDIVFKQNETVDIDALKMAVEDAGFSVGSLQMTGNFDNVKISDDQHIRLGKDNFHFIDVDGQVLNGEKTIRVLDKDFVTAKVFKKYSAATKMSCMQTGKAAACCVKEGITEGARIYHVTI